MSRKPAQQYQDELPAIKKDIEGAIAYFKDNNKRFHEFQKFTFKTALTSSEEAALSENEIPKIEYNIVNAPISRLCGEFFKNEPSISVSAKSGSNMTPDTMKMIETVEGHMRYIFEESRRHNTQYNVYRDQLSGGFSSFKVWTEYANEKSFDQDIRFGRVFDPTMAGYDPMAREVDKSDAMFSFEQVPYDIEEFKKLWPWVDISNEQFIRSPDENAFNWTYSIDNKTKVIVVCDYFRRKKKTKKIVKLADHTVMFPEEYEEFLKDWNKKGFMEVPPAIIDERETEITYIGNYKLMQKEVLEYKETSFKYNPRVFVDGDSVVIRDNDDSSIKQFTKPYVFHAKGIQRLTNLAGQMIANDFMMVVQHKFIIAEEALPSQEDSLEALKNPQKAQTLVYKRWYDDDPSKMNDPPIPVQRIGLPAEVVNTFNNSMAMLQNILGAYDAALGINDNQLSGVAIVEAATQSNAAAMPYIVNYMQALTQVANIILDLIPKYYVTPRSIPVISKEGDRGFVNINQPGGVYFKYDENLLQVKVEAGVNFAIAKNKALQQIIALKQSSELFAQFINEQGLDVILDNVEFRGSDILKERAKVWMENKQKESAEKSKQPTLEQIQGTALMQETKNSTDRTAIEAQKVQHKREETEAKVVLDTEKLILEKQKEDNERLKILLAAGESKEQIELGLKKAEAEEVRAAADLHLKTHDQVHSHSHDVAKLIHDIEKGEKHEETDQKEGE